MRVRSILWRRRPATRGAKTAGMDLTPRILGALAPPPVEGAVREEADRAGRAVPARAIPAPLRITARVAGLHPPGVGRRPGPTVARPPPARLRTSILKEARARVGVGGVAGVIDEGVGHPPGAIRVKVRRPDPGSDPKSAPRPPLATARPAQVRPPRLGPASALPRRVGRRPQRPVGGKVARVDGGRARKAAPEARVLVPL